MPPAISEMQLALCAGFVLLAGAASWRLGLGLGRELAVGAVRTVAQLYLMGYVLVYVFRLQNPWLTLAIMTVMVVTASRIVRGKVSGPMPGLWRDVLLSMALSYAVVTYAVVGVIIGAEPWWEPRIAIPIAGMVAGNSMNGMALGLERLFSDTANRRAQVETLLCLGATPHEATADIFRDAIRAGLMPSVNAMLGVGLVFLPGMMTGQILAGADPVEAIKYQIVVMFMLVGSAAIGNILALGLARRKMFDSAGALASPSLAKRTPS